MEYKEFEKQFGVKLLTYDEYDELMKEKDKLVQLVDDKDKALAKKETELTTVTKQRDIYKKSSPIGKFCEKCKWESNISCGERVEYLQEKQPQTSKEEIVLWMIEKFPSCAKN